MSKRKRLRTKVDEFLHSQGFRTVGENDDLPPGDMQPQGLHRMPNGQYAGFRRDPQMPLPVVGPGSKPEPKPDISHLLVDPAIMGIFMGVSLGAPQADQPLKPTQIGLFSDGVFKMVTTAVGQTVVQVAAFEDKGLPPRPAGWQVGFHLLVPKIPADLLFSVMSFFRAVEQRDQSEAFVSVWLEDGIYRVEVPEQEVSGAKVDHLQDASVITGQQIMQIHSHVNMEAFWSGTDDGDEQQQGNLLYGVVGKISWDIPKSKWRTRAGNQFVDLDMGGLFEFVDYMVTHRLNGKALVTGGGSEKGITQQPVRLQPLEKATFPPEWLEKVSKKSYTVAGFTVNSGYTYCGNGAYTPSAWVKDARAHLDGDKPQKYQPWWDSEQWHEGGD